MKDDINKLLDNAFTGFQNYTTATEEQHQAIQDSITTIADLLMKQLETA